MSDCKLLVAEPYWTFLASSKQEWRATQEEKAPQPPDVVAAPQILEALRGPFDGSDLSLASRYTAFRLAIEQAVPKGVTVVTDVVGGESGDECLVEFWSGKRREHSAWPLDKAGAAIVWMRGVVDRWATELGREVMGKR